MADVLQLVGIVAGMAVFLGAVLHAEELLDRARGAGVRLGLVAPPEPPPAHQAVDRLAHDVHRIRADLAAMDPQVPHARRVGILAAYDDALVDACRALGIDDTLSGVPAGLDREVERLRVEDALVRAGLIPGRTPGR